MNKIKKMIVNSKGSTIVELLIYMGLLLMLVAVFTQIFSAMVEIKLETEANSYVEEDYSYISSKLKYDMRRASSITIPAAVGDTSSTLTINIGGISFTYGLSNGNLTYTDPSGNNNLNSSEVTVSDLSFKRLGNLGGKNIIQTSMKLTSKATPVKGAEVKDLRLNLGLR